MLHYKIKYTDGAWHVFRRGFFNYDKLTSKGLPTLDDAYKEYEKLTKGIGILRVDYSTEE